MKRSFTSLAIHHNHTHCKLADRTIARAELALIIYKAVIKSTLLGLSKIWLSKIRLSTEMKRSFTSLAIHHNHTHCKLADRTIARAELALIIYKAVIKSTLLGLSKIWLSKIRLSTEMKRSFTSLAIHHNHTHCKLADRTIARAELALIIYKAVIKSTLLGLSKIWLSKIRLSTEMKRSFTSLAIHHNHTHCKLADRTIARAELALIIYKAVIKSTLLGLSKINEVKKR